METEAAVAGVGSLFFIIFSMVIMFVVYVPLIVMSITAMVMYVRLYIRGNKALDKYIKENSPTPEMPLQDK